MVIKKTVAWNVAIALSVMSQVSAAELLSVCIEIGATLSSTGVAIGGDSQANNLSVSIGENAGQNSVGTNSLYIGANVGKNVEGSYNQIAGNSIGNSLLGDVNSIFGSGYDMCLTNVSNPFSFSGCGAQTKVEGSLNSLFGNMTNVTVLGDRNIAFGSNTGSVEGSDNISIGTDAGPGYYIGNLYLGNDFNSGFVTPIKVSNTTSIGSDASASTSSSIAIGNLAKVKGDLESEFGAVGANSVAIGPFSLVDKSSSAVAIGSGSKVLDSDLSVALGANSIADKEKVVSVGSATLKREIINVAEGTTLTSAVNLGQVQQMIGQSAFQGIPGLVIENNETSVGMRSSASESNMALGYKATSTGTNSVAIGNDSFTSDEDVDVVSFGNANRNLTRRLTNVSDGINYSDAATIGQVRSMFDSLSLNMPAFIPELTVVQNQIVTDENGNTVVGAEAGSGSSGSDNVLLGASSGTNSTGDNNVLLGVSSGSNSTGDNIMFSLETNQI
jgi:trimeric autotransporter adhesin